MSDLRCCLDCVYGFSDPDWIDFEAHKNWPALELGKICTWGHEKKTPEFYKAEALDQSRPFVNCSGHKKAERVNPYLRVKL